MLFRSCQIFFSNSRQPCIAVLRFLKKPCSVLVKNRETKRFEQGKTTVDCLVSWPQLPRHSPSKSPFFPGRCCKVLVTRIEVDDGVFMQNHFYLDAHNGTPRQRTTIIILKQSFLYASCSSCLLDSPISRVSQPSRSKRSVKLRSGISFVISNKLNSSRACHTQ